MKKFVAVVACLASVSSFAQSTELRFGDVNYFLKKNEFNLTADVDLNSYEERRNTGGTGETLETEGYYTRSRFAYALADNLNLFLGLNYNYDVEVYSEGNADYSQDGLMNPILGANYRLINQDQAAVNVDFGVVARLNIEDQEIGDATGGSAKDGNAAIGNNALEINSRIGRKWNEANEWQLAAGVIYNFDGEYDLLSAGGSKTKFDTDASVDAFLRATYQYRPVHEFMMNVFAQGTRVGEIDAEGSGVTRDAESHIDFDFGFNAKYLITDGFIFRFGLGQGNNPDFKVSSNTSGAEYKVVRRHEYNYGVGLDFLF